MDIHADKDNASHKLEQVNLPKPEFELPEGVLAVLEPACEAVANDPDERDSRPEMFIHDLFYRLREQHSPGVEAEGNWIEVIELIGSDKGKVELASFLKSYADSIDVEKVLEQLRSKAERIIFESRENRLWKDVSSLFTTPVTEEDISRVEGEFKSLMGTCEVGIPGEESFRVITDLEEFRKNPSLLYHGDVKVGESSSSANILSDLLERIDLLHTRMAVSQHQNCIDWEKVEKNRLVYGAKGSMLLELRELEAIAEELVFPYKVPEFDLVPVSVYKDYGKGLDIDKGLKPFYEQFKGRKFIVRSSGVFAEDGENMGAGIYDSIGITEHGTFEDFKKAVIQVYESVDSELACSYRHEYGVDSEEMGLVVQEFIYESAKGVSRGASLHGYVNSQRTNIPEILDVVFEERGFERSGNLFRPTTKSINAMAFDRAELNVVDIFDDGEGCLCFTSDHTQELGGGYQAVMAGKLTMFLETCFGKGLQTEFVQTSGINYMQQARQLPEKWLEKKEIQFPQSSNYIWRARSLGVLEEELDILADEDNSAKKGVVIISSSHRGGDFLGWISQVLPAEGAVLLLNSAEYKRGHIESRALERGLTIISGEAIVEEGQTKIAYYDRLWKAYGGEGREVFNSEKNRRPVLLEPNERFNKLRLVSNGLEGRVYLIMPESVQ